MSVEKAVHAYLSRFGHEPEWVAVAPGRVNLIGEHTDYNDGFVFPAAVDFEIAVAASRCPAPTVLVSELAGEGQPFDARSVELGQVDGFTRYVAGMPWSFRQAGCLVQSNFRAVVVSELPMGAGVSSSAALENVFGVLWNEVDQLGLSPKQIALLGVRCENEYVGMNCGIMDQLASALGKKGHALFIDTRSQEVELVPIPSGLAMVICDTGKSRELAGSKYNERRGECELAAQAIGVKALRDADVDQLNAVRDSVSHTVYRRARHVITENRRCVEFAQALRSGDLEGLGDLMRASHISLRDDYEVSCEELDTMATAAWDAPGCLGARLTGAGFGGACIALVEQNSVPEFVRVVESAYRARHRYEPRFLPCEASDGARIVQSPA